ncbi:nitrate/nitrite transporter [Paracraurococcus lichenis]|uniref:MFS transporter n=1 Tax=Paracraurococcus lichenis TaxID=3064888 RepID=A0ABT9E3R4_9PROT|nr:MFS transporter [Paracraurococcus sp. LOR1-02]MDO9710809.1 MFS transporter [Paracraurococcus sp. LOR1-02]
MNSMTGDTVSGGDRTRALWSSTAAFTVCFAAWTIFSILGIQAKRDLGLTDFQFGLLVGTPILTGSLIRLVLGIWADQYGGRRVFALVMLAAAAATWMLSYAYDYTTFLLAALGVGIAGGSFSVGVAYVSKWYPKERQGTALGIFGAGNVGSAVTKFLAPSVMLAFGWHALAQIWAVALAVTAVLFFLTTKDDPDLAARRARGAQAESFAAMMEPLRNLQVWRFSLYYFFVFGGFVALALWLPRYIIDAYGFDIRTAGLIGAAYSVPASIFRAYGGVLSDRYGARRVMYWTFGVAVACTFLLSYPPTDYVVQGIKGPMTFHLETGVWSFIALVFVLGFFMSLGKAAVYKHIPVYYPGRVGAVGGVVGLIGGLGGFVLPLAFGLLNDLTGLRQSCFMLLFLVALAGLAWMHLAIRRMEREAAAPVLRTLPELPEMQPIHGPAQHGALSGRRAIEDWRPEDAGFWAERGRAVARRNLWVSIPCLFLSFAVWMVWSVVVAKLPAAGFRFGTDQLFWLAALPGLSGATLRVFYSFMPAILGGRLWTTLSTWSLLVPALGIGWAVQDPATPYWIFLALALLCGFGGGNFASSMANIAFFFPRREKGNALALNAGLGNLGVSAVQFLVPLAITAGVFGSLGGAPQQTAQGASLWLQNAGLIWVPMIAIAAFAAWFRMDDLASMRASFAEQSVIFRRRHTWVMCWLYTGTFGSFIGFSAGFPLLARTEFPTVDALSLAFLGPLVGALARSMSGWIADRWGGGRVTFWVFVGMVLATAGVVHFLGIKDQPGAFLGFFGCFLVLFLLTGIGNASTFQMIPAIMTKEMARLMPGAGAAERRQQAEREGAAIIGFTSAIAAFGAFFVPKAYGSAIALTGRPQAALWAFAIFYLTCIALTWAAYTRRGGLLHAIERGRAAVQPAE